MTRLLTCGWETGDVNEVGALGSSGINPQTNVTAASSNPAPRAGGAYCWRSPTSNGGAQSIGVFRTIVLPTALTEFWARIALFYGSSLGGEMVFFGMYDSTGGAQTCVTFNASDGTVRARLGISGAVLATSAIGLFIGAWNVFEVHWQASSTTVGVVEVYGNGARLINFSGDNTATATPNVQRIAVGGIDSVGGSGVAYGIAGVYFALDDLALNDTNGTVNNGRVGDGRIVLLTPIGAGSSTVLTRGGTDTGANWNQESELPPSMSQYVLSANPADRDLYNMSNLPSIPIASINVVEAIALAQNSDAGTGSLGLTIKSGSTTNEAPAQVLSSSAGYVVARWETDPNTSAAWTVSGVNALEAGPTVR